MPARSRKFVEDDLRQISATYDALAKEHQFAMWTLSVMHYAGDLEATTLEEIYQNTYALLEEGEPGDSCLDGYFLENDTNSLYLYQVKWPDSPNRYASASDAREVANSLTILLNDLGSERPVPEPRSDAVAALRRVLDEQGRIILRGVSGGRWRTTHRDRIKELLPPELPLRVDVELFGLEELRSVLAERTQDLAGETIELSLLSTSSDPILLFPSQGVTGMGDAVTVLLSAWSLADASSTWGQRLFEKNVRLYLGRGRVNKDIESTLTDDNERKSFWYGHNGITILCDHYSVLPSQSDPQQVRMRNPQIVNGCQTATTLNRVFGKPESRRGKQDFAILSRIIELHGDKAQRESAAELIAYRTNSQASVNDADLRANDPHQRNLQNILDRHGRRWFYERKRGEWKNLTRNRKAHFRERGRQDRVISRDVYQQAWRAYTGHPAAAITKKNAVWERGSGRNGDLYSIVFDMNRRAADVVFVSVLFDWFAQVFSVRHDNSSLCIFIHGGLRNHVSTIRRAKMLIAAHCIALFGSLVEQAYEDQTEYPEDCIQKLVNHLDGGRYVRSNWSSSSWKPLRRFMKPLMLSWVNYILEVERENTTLYAALKQDTAFTRLREILESMMDVPAAELVKPA